MLRNPEWCLCFFHADMGYGAAIEGLVCWCRRSNFFLREEEMYWLGDGWDGWMDVYVASCGFYYFFELVF